MTRQEYNMKVKIIKSLVTPDTEDLCTAQLIRLYLIFTYGPDYENN